MKLLIVNGPNLNLLGVRQPEIYGKQSMEQYLDFLHEAYPDIELEYFQSNCEGFLIDELQRAGFQGSEYTGIILNAGAYTHTSLALADCIAAIEVPVIEVHISNTAAREDLRHRSLIAGVCRGTITGFGMESYRLAVEAFI